MNNILVKTTKHDTFDTMVACARTAQSLGRVLGYLEDANDITIGFIGLTDERRDLICKTDYTIASTKKALLRTSPSHGRKNANAILCGSPIGRLEEPVLDKLICHEIGHNLGPNIANNWTMATQRFQHLFSSHPSFYTRYKRSDENCPLYLEQKKQLGIPSLVVG